jgi:uncharacterized protein with HEPN domain
MPSDREATRRWLTDIQHHIAMAECFVADMDYGSFKDDNRTLYAVVRCLEIYLRGIAALAERIEGTAPIDWLAGNGSNTQHQSA